MAFMSIDPRWNIKRMYEVCLPVGFEGRFKNPVVISKVNGTPLHYTITDRVMHRKLQIARAEMAEMEKAMPKLAEWRKAHQITYQAKSSVTKGLIKRK